MIPLLGIGGAYDYDCLLPTAYQGQLTKNNLRQVRKVDWHQGANPPYRCSLLHYSMINSRALKGWEPETPANSTIHYEDRKKKKKIRHMRWSPALEIFHAFRDALLCMESCISVFHTGTSFVRSAKHSLGPHSPSLTSHYVYAAGRDMNLLSVRERMKPTPHPPLGNLLTLPYKP